MKLFFDIGNTNIKILFHLQNQEFIVSYNTKNNYSVDSFYQMLPTEIKNNKISKVVICSVVPQVEDVVAGLSKKYWNVQPQLIKYPIKTGIKIKANNPQAVGADLIALAVFANNKSNKSIVVNMGTATTIIVVENQTLDGVIIAPGLMTSYESLISNASKIPSIELLKDIKELNVGHSTQEAVSIGVLKGHAEMIRGLVNRVKSSHKLFLSGGHSKKVKDLLSEFEFIKEATLKGIQIIEELNEK